ncbi:BcpO-related WXXGXW repeat protein [Paraburkholderia aspalathi]|nr:BcpO-related WXXGXW repeat protein [Paraburkholderia aspalathi]
MKKNFLVLALSVACTASLAPVAANAQVGIAAVINQRPPPRYEAVPQAHPGQVWASGYWAWTGRQYVWTKGHWERARYGYRYDRPQWVQGRYGWKFHQGGWQRFPRAMMPPARHYY